MSDHELARRTMLTIREHLALAGWSELGLAPTDPMPATLPPQGSRRRTTMAISSLEYLRDLRESLDSLTTEFVADAAHGGRNAEQIAAAVGMSRSGVVKRWPLVTRKADAPRAADGPGLEVEILDWLSPSGWRRRPRRLRIFRDQAGTRVAIVDDNTDSSSTTNEAERIAEQVHREFGPDVEVYGYTAHAYDDDHDHLHRLLPATPPELQTIQQSSSLARRLGLEEL